MAAEPDPENNPPAIAKATSAPRRPVFWMVWWLVIAFVLIKMCHFGLPPLAHPAGLWIYESSVLVATARDNLFALGLGIVAVVSLALLVRWPRAHRLACAAWIIICTFCVLLAIVNAFVFAEIQTPITRALLVAAGDWGNMRSSLAPFFEAPTLAALTGGPLLYMLLVVASNRAIGAPRSRAARGFVVLLALGVLGQYTYARSVARLFSRRADHSIAVSTHWALFSEYILRLGDHKMTLPPNIPPANDAEFLPLRDRAASGKERVPYPLPCTGRPRHVIVLVLESVGTKFLHLYGSPYLTTANLEAEAKNALVLDNFYCHVGRTASSMVAICNSNYPRPNWQPNIYDPKHDLNQPGVSLVQVLKPRGFRTLALSSTDLNDFQMKDFLLYCGFDEVWDKRNLPGRDVTTWGKDDGPVIDRLMEWIDQDPTHARPFFALCWTNQTHQPYKLSVGQTEVDMLGAHVPPPPAEVGNLNLYLNTLAEADRIVERMLNELRKRGLADDTLVILVGDHGEAFRWPHNTRFHGYHVFDENVRVPCVFWCPRLFSPGRRITTVAGHIDLNPTITDLLGLEPAGTWQGSSLFDPARPARTYFYASIEDYYLGVREGDWKFIYDATTGFDELYNVRLDPQEADDVSGANPAICAALRGHVGAWVLHLDRYGAGVRP